MSIYLERNAALVAEINTEVEHGLTFDKVNTAKSESGTEYYTVGSYTSKVLDRPLFLGLKQKRSLQPQRLAFYDLALANAISIQVPQLEPELPVLVGLLSHLHDGDMGEVVEDVSEGGSQQVTEIREGRVGAEELLPFELRNINPNLTNEQLASMTFLIGNIHKRRKILDFRGLLSGMDPEEMIEIFSYVDIARQGESYTVYTSKI